MAHTERLTAAIGRENGLYVALCPEVDVVSQGGSVEAPRANLVGALVLIFEWAPPEEVVRRAQS